MFGRHIRNHLREECGRRFARGGFMHGAFDHHEGGHRGRGGRHGFGRGGRERVFDHGDLRFVILALIAEKPRYGYDIIKAIEDKLSGAYSPSPGVIYPTLTMLEELGYAAITPEGAKKLYSITPEGTAFLEANKPVVDGIFARMAETGEAHGGGRAPQIVRAVENLKLALRLRLSRGPMNAEEVQKIAEILDRTVADLERS